jgi:hypothetical protein
MSRRPSYTEKRRARLAMKWDRLQQLEPKNTITEPISVFALSTSALRGLAQIGIMEADGGNGGLLVAARLAWQARHGPTPIQKAPSAPHDSIPIGLDLAPQVPAAGGSATPDLSLQGPTPHSNEPAVLLNLASAAGTSGDSFHGISAPWHPASPSVGGGALPARGGSGGPSPALIAAASPGGPTPHARNPALNAPGGPASAVGPAAPFPAIAFGGGSSPHAASTTISRNPLAHALNGGHARSPELSGASPDTGSPFELETLDYTDGSVMVPGFEQLATPGGSVDLRAQVRDSATGTYTYSWSTTGLTSANSISGASTYDLTFDWNTSIATASAESATLTVTDPSLNQVIQTYTFWVPAGTGTATGGTTWNNSTLDPGLLQASAPSFASQNVSVVEDTGALETSIDMPSYNPNVPALALNYDSLAANATPIIVAEHALSPSLSTPSQVSAQLTFNGTAGSTYYYSTSTLRPGDIMQIGLQATGAATLDTGSYPYTMTIADIRGGAPTTVTYAGNATVENAAEDATFSPLGKGWTVSGLEKIIPATGGVILDEGDGTVAWFSGSFGIGGGTYTSPAGTFSTLVLNSNGTYALTFTDGTVENFNSSGLETTSVDSNGRATTFGYTGSRLLSITDPFGGGITTLTYGGGSSQLQSIEDAASRFTTFTLSGGELTAVEYPDDSTWNYGYTSGQARPVGSARSPRPTARPRYFRPARFRAGPTAAPRAARRRRYCSRRSAHRSPTRSATSRPTARTGAAWAWPTRKPTPWAT